MEDTTESDPREVEAASYNLNYVQVSRGILSMLPVPKRDYHATVLFDDNVSCIVLFSVLSF